MAYLARQYPDRRFITVSPGNTTGTHAPNDFPLPMRVAAKYVMPALGLAHKLDVGAKRLVDGVTDPSLSSGKFYASAANTLTGPGQPGGLPPRSGQPVVSGQRQRSHPPLHHPKDSRVPPSPGLGDRPSTFDFALHLVVRTVVREWRAGGKRFRAGSKAVRLGPFPLRLLQRFACN